jgi:hypothetical protein
LFSLTLKVFVTHHCIENIQKSDKKGVTQCHTQIHPILQIIHPMSSAWLARKRVKQKPPTR